MAWTQVTISPTHSLACALTDPVLILFARSSRNLCIPLKESYIHAVNGHNSHSLTSASLQNIHLVCDFFLPRSEVSVTNRIVRSLH